MFFVKAVVLEQVVNRLLRLSAAAALGNVAWVRGHGHEVEICGKAVKCRKCNIEKEVRVQGGWGNGCQHWQGR